MNLKEAFRFQNKLEGFLSSASDILSDKNYVTKTKRTYLYKKADPNAENQTIVDNYDEMYNDHVNELIAFSMYLLDQKIELTSKINECKKNLNIDLDGEISLNRNRQELANLFRMMARIKSSEVCETNAGTGYRFNNEGNQVSYRCDVEVVTTINFDRNAVRKYASRISEKSDTISTEIDKCLVESTVNYNPPFDVNSSFEDIFEEYLTNNNI